MYEEMLRELTEWNEDQQAQMTMMAIARLRMEANNMEFEQERKRFWDSINRK